MAIKYQTPSHLAELTCQLTADIYLSLLTRPDTDINDETLVDVAHFNATSLALKINDIHQESINEVQAV